MSTQRLDYAAGMVEHSAVGLLEVDIAGHGDLYWVTIRDNGKLAETLEANSMRAAKAAVRRWVSARKLEAVLQWIF